MKATILIITLTLSQIAYSARTCALYIPDEWPDSRYTVADISGDNVVTDNKTGLMWKQCSEGLSGTDCVTDSVTTHTWQQALEVADTQNNSGFAGFSDWRLPNQKELQTLVARNCNNPSINETVFLNTPSNLFWSSSPFAGYDSYARIVEFYNGDDDEDDRNISGHVRLVRSLGQ